MNRRPDVALLINRLKPRFNPRGAPCPNSETVRDPFSRERIIRIIIFASES